MEHERREHGATERRLQQVNKSDCEISITLRRNNPLFYIHHLPLLTCNYETYNGAIHSVIQMSECFSQLQFQENKYVNNLTLISLSFFVITLKITYRPMLSLIVIVLMHRWISIFDMTENFGVQSVGAPLG